MNEPNRKEEGLVVLNLNHVTCQQSKKMWLKFKQSNLGSQLFTKNFLKFNQCLMRDQFFVLSNNFKKSDSLSY